MNCMYFMDVLELKKRTNAWTLNEVFSNLVTMV